MQYAVKFQFPSNGKVNSEEYRRAALRLLRAIRFQFPSNGKVNSELKLMKSLLFIQSRFNSLQTGKWIQRFVPPQTTVPWRTSVSIPFKRESEFRDIRFNRAEQFARAEFQFPSNGKVNSEEALEALQFVWNAIVSIPFKRESGFRVQHQIHKITIIMSFNSLQTGKGIQSHGGHQ